MLNSGFRKLAAGVAMAVGLGIGSAQAAINTDGVTGDPLSVNGGGTGIGELFFSIFDGTNFNSLTLDLNVGVKDFLLNPLAGVSVQNDALKNFIANGDQGAMEWNVGGISNDGTLPGLSGVFVVTTVRPGATPSAFPDVNALAIAMSNAGAYVGAVNDTIANDTTTANAGPAYYNFGSWGSNFGTPLPFSNAVDLGDMITAEMVIVGNDGINSVLVPNAALAQGFWSLDGATGTVGFQPVPIPAAVWLFGSAILGLVGIRRRA